MIKYVTGRLGMGKSLYGARAIATALNHGKVVVANVRLVDDFERVILRHNPYYRFSSKPTKRILEVDMRRRFCYEPDLVRLLGARITGYGESRGVRVFDEAHNNLNSRDWKDDIQKLMLRRLTLSRKRGWDDYIISQHAKNTDVAIRRIADSEIRLIDWQKITRIPILDTKLLPFHLFLAQEFPIEDSAVPGVQKVGKRISAVPFLLGWWRKIYDTFEDFEFDDDLDDSGIVMPLSADDPRAMGGRVLAQLPEAGEDEASPALRVVLGGVGGLPELMRKPPDAST